MKFVMVIFQFFNILIPKQINTFGEFLPIAITTVENTF
jgi:hypothetical protein